MLREEARDIELIKMRILCKHREIGKTGRSYVSQRYATTVVRLYQYYCKECGTTSWNWRHIGGQ